MEQDWSTKKKLLFWSAFIAVIVIACILSEFFPAERLRDNFFLNVVLYVVFGYLILAFICGVIWVAIMIPLAITMDMRQKRKIRHAKSSAYDIVDTFGTLQLKENNDYYRLGELKKGNEIAEIMEVLDKHYRIHYEDEEVRHLLFDLSELERALGQISDEQIEKEMELQEERKESAFLHLLKAISDSDLRAMKKKYKDNAEVTKKLDDELIRRKAEEAEKK